MSEIAPVETDAPATLSHAEIMTYARNMARQIERENKIAFFGSWLTKLNLTSTVERLEKAGTITK